MSDTPKSHPRYVSLQIRDRIVAGVEAGVTSAHGLIAHGRGEAFDYLVGEATSDFAFEAINCTAALLLLATKPVLSMNGNSTALVPREMVELAEVLNCPLEVNIFHSSTEREQRIKEWLLQHGAKTVLMPERESTLDYIDSNRRYVNAAGILTADCVFVPLEDGDRCEALVKMGKKVVVVDLNPLSRTAQTATVTIVDNVVRAVPALINAVRRLKDLDQTELNQIVQAYDQQVILQKAQNRIRGLEL